MNWENILKVQVLGNKQKVKMGIKPLPKESNCKDKIREFFEKAKSMHSEWYSAPILRVDSLSRMSEKVACEILQFIQNYKIDTIFKLSKRNGQLHRVADEFTPMNQENSMYYAVIGTTITESYVQLFCQIRIHNEVFPIVDIQTKKFHDYVSIQSIPNNTDFKEHFEKIDWRK